MVIPMYDKDYVCLILFSNISGLLIFYFSSFLWGIFVINFSLTTYFFLMKKELKLTFLISFLILSFYLILNFHIFLILGSIVLLFSIILYLRRENCNEQI